MANNLIQIKRTSVSGRAANTTTLPNPGELAINITDGIMYSTNGSVVFEVGANNTNSQVSGTLTVNSVSANGSLGTDGQVLTSNGTTVYWSAVSAGGGGTVSQVNTGVGLTGGPIDTTGTISVNPNTGIVANASGLFVNSAYIATLDANNASYLNGNTAADLRSYSDTIAGTAYSNAVSTASTDATNKAANAYSNAVSYAGTIASTAYSNAVATAASDATSKAATAYSNSVSYAGTIADTAYSNAVSTAATDATNKAANAYSNAISYAGTIAATAYSNAVSTAAADATSKAATAYSNAVSTAATDATNKAANAYSNSVTYFNANVNNAIDARVTQTFVNNLNVDADTLDSLDSTQFLRSDANDTATGIITFTGNVNSTATLDANVITVDTLQFLGGTGTQGTITWNTDEETIDIIQNGATLQVGQEIHYHVKNQTGSLIPDGTAVMAVGTLGNSGRILVAPMVANGSVLSKYYIGVTTEDIGDGEDGKVTHFGKIRDVDLSTYSEGDLLWLDPANTGGLTVTRPEAPNLKIPTAIVISNTSNGTMFVRVQTGHRMDEMHDTEITSVANNQMVVYDSVDGRWENRTVNTSIIVEGTNLYYTTARANSAIDARVTKSFVDSLGINANTVGGNTASDLRSYSDTIAGTAYSNAVSTASADATSKAATAYSNAVSYAGTIAGTAYSNAVSTAATDATNKAATAYSNSVSYFDSNVNTAIDARVTKTFIDNLNVDADTLDSLDSTQFLRSDAADTATGAITFSANISVSTVLANSSPGSAGQVLTSNGTVVYWTDPAGGGGGYYFGDNGTVGDANNASNIFRVNNNTLNANVTFANGQNGSATGPLTVASGATLTIQSGARVAIV